MWTLVFDINTLLWERAPVKDKSITAGRALDLQRAFFLFSILTFEGKSKNLNMVNVLNGAECITLKL